MATQPRALAIHRFGYGPFAGRLPDFAPADRLDGPDDTAKAFGGETGQDVLDRLARYRASAREAKGDAAKRKARRDGQREARLRSFVNARLELARAVEAEDGYRERLVRFWADHFTVAARRKVELTIPTPFADDAIRPNVAKPFATLLRAAITHPAMLGYLDQSSSVAPESAYGKRVGRGLNENLARELLELHTLGVGGGYDQADVRQAALLLTGLAVNGTKGMVYLDQRANPGPETVLGKTYGGPRKSKVEDVYQLLDDLAVHPATAQHICGKLAVHFIADTPDKGLVADLAAVWTRTDGDLAAVCRALCDHPAANQPVLQKARQPFDFLVAAFRALGVRGADIMGWDDATLRRVALTPMAEMGQRWQSPNGPDGWEEDLGRWITPQALATRIDWGMQMPRRLRKDLPDAREFVELALVDLADDQLRTLVARAETNAEGVGLVLASPMFNRR